MHSACLAAMIGCLTVNSFNGTNILGSLKGIQIFLCIYKQFFSETCMNFNRNPQAERSVVWKVLCLLGRFYYICSISSRRKDTFLLIVLWIATEVILDRAFR